MKFIDDLKDTPVLIVTGTGGVGKTTMSCALAIALAQENNARVLVITIDPARRLASVLCEDSLDHTPRAIDHSRFVEGKKTDGEVFAAMVDTQVGWKEIVNRYAKSEKDANRIFSNKLYRNLTSRFSHSHDFVAMDQLYEHYRSGSFDFIVLDTPPTSQAFGFFDAPQAMSDFFGGRLVKLITSPYRLGSGRAAKLFDLASQPFFALADKVLGKQFLNDIGEFFFLFHTMYDDFVDRATSITEFLTSSRVHATLVMSPTQFISRSYESMCDGLNDRKINLDYLVVNNVAFSPSDDTEILDFVESSEAKSPKKIDSAIARFMRNDWNISQEVYHELENRHDSFKERRGASEQPVVIARRALALDELQRVCELVSDVQNTHEFDDTI